MNHFLQCSKKAIIGIALILLGADASAQSSLIQAAIHKLENYKDFSYRFDFKIKEYQPDTSISHFRHSFSKAPGDKAIGYLFRLEERNEHDELRNIKFYNGQNVVSLFPGNSTYNEGKVRPSDVQMTLLSNLPLV